MGDGNQGKRGKLPTTETKEKGGEKESFVIKHDMKEMHDMMEWKRKEWWGNDGTWCKKNCGVKGSEEEAKGEKNDGGGDDGSQQNDGN